jgi:hypothetical protein
MGGEQGLDGWMGECIASCPHEESKHAQQREAKSSQIKSCQARTPM